MMAQGVSEQRFVTLLLRLKTYSEQGKVTGQVVKQCIYSAFSFMIVNQYMVISGQESGIIAIVKALVNSQVICLKLHSSLTSFHSSHIISRV